MIMDGLGPARSPWRGPTAAERLTDPRHGCGRTTASAGAGYYAGDRSRRPRPIVVCGTTATERTAGPSHGCGWRAVLSVPATTPEIGAPWPAVDHGRPLPIAGSPATRRVPLPRRLTRELASTRWRLRPAAAHFRRAPAASKINRSLRPPNSQRSRRHRQFPPDAGPGRLGQPMTGQLRTVIRPPRCDWLPAASAAVIVHSTGPGPVNPPSEP